MEDGHLTGTHKVKTFLVQINRCMSVINKPFLLNTDESVFFQFCLHFFFIRKNVTLSFFLSFFLTILSFVFFLPLCFFHFSFFLFISLRISSSCLFRFSFPSFFLSFFYFSFIHLLWLHLFLYSSINSNPNHVCFFLRPPTAKTHKNCQKVRTSQMFKRNLFCHVVHNNLPDSPTSASTPPFTACKKKKKQIWKFI